jgi:hypothetical protein
MDWLAKRRRQRKQEDGERVAERQRRTLAEAKAKRELKNQLNQRRVVALPSKSADDSTRPAPASASVPLVAPKPVVKESQPVQRYVKSGVLPAAVDFAHLKASPASSLSMSQSQTPEVAKKRPRLLMYDSSDHSSDEEDMVEFHRKKILREELEARGGVENTPDKPSPPKGPPREIHKVGDKNDLKEGDYLKRQSEPKQPPESSEQVTTTTTEIPQQPKEPRIPLVPTIYAPLYPKTPATSFPAHQDQDDSLWDDSDEERPASQNKKKKPEPQDKKKKPKKKQEQARDNTYRTRVVEFTERDDGADVTALKPEFASPKFGPFELEPLVLGPPERTNRHQVPASIKRYLPEYQQEGIRFLYDQAILLRRGAILGDGKLLSSVVHNGILSKHTQN